MLSQKGKALDIQEEGSKDWYIKYSSGQENLYYSMIEENYSRQEYMTETIAFSSKTDEDIMYFHRDIKQPYNVEFLKVIIREVNIHYKNKHCRLIPK